MAAIFNGLFVVMEGYLGFKSLELIYWMANKKMVNAMFPEKPIALRNPSMKLYTYTRTWNDNTKPGLGYYNKNGADGDNISVYDGFTRFTFGNTDQAWYNIRSYMNDNRPNNNWMPMQNWDGPIDISSEPVNANGFRIRCDAPDMCTIDFSTPTKTDPQGKRYNQGPVHY
jgi:hypothetical protein